MTDRIVHNRSAIAMEGWPWLLGAMALAIGCFYFQWNMAAAIASVGAVALFFLFRDPQRVVPPLPAAVYAPVDGRVLAVENPGPSGEDLWQRIRIRTSRLGAYTVRAPIEGTVRRVSPGFVPGLDSGGLCLRSEEADDVVVAFPLRGWLRAPRAFVRYGERLGQGHRFAYLRLAPVAEVYVPASSRLLVGVGDRVRAGATSLADLVND